MRCRVGLHKMRIVGHRNPPELGDVWTDELECQRCGRRGTLHHTVDGSMVSR